MFIAQSYEEARLKQLAAHADGPEVLDLGCAQGMNPHLLRPGRCVTGLDMIQPTSAVRYDRFLVGDVFDLAKLDDGRRYDSIVAGEFIEHVERPYDLLRALRGHLKPGGRLILSTPNPLAPAVLPFEWLRSRRRFYASDHTYYFTPRWMERVLERCGFRVRRVAGVGLWPLAIPCPVGLSYQVIYVAE